MRVSVRQSRSNSVCGQHREREQCGREQQWMGSTDREQWQSGQHYRSCCASVAIINYIFSLWPNNFLFLDLRKQVPHQFHYTQILHAVAASIKWLITRMHRNCQSVAQWGKKQSGSLILIYYSRINKTKTRKQQRTKRQWVRGSEGGGSQSISSHFDMEEKEQ